MSALDFDIKLQSVERFLKRKHGRQRRSQRESSWYSSPGRKKSLRN